MKHIVFILLAILLNGCNVNKPYRIVGEEPTEIGKNQILVWAVVEGQPSDEEMKQYLNEIYSEAEQHVFSNGNGPALIGVYLYLNETRYKNGKENFELMKFKGPLDAAAEVSYGPTSTHNKIQ